MFISPDPEWVRRLTPQWAGARSRDGRPRVADDVLRALAGATAEHAWHVLHENGFPAQFCGRWRETRPGQTMVGRCVTSRFVPLRPDLERAVEAAGEREGHLKGAQHNQWVIETLETGDALIGDIFGKVREGTVLGDNLGTAVATRTGVGAVIDGGVRDYSGLQELAPPVNIFFREVDPTPIEQVTLTQINGPVMIGGVTVLPGDVVLGTTAGVTFIPPHLAEQVAELSVDLRARDEFGKRRLSEGRFTTADIDVTPWPDHVERDFEAWRRTR